MPAKKLKITTLPPSSATPLLRRRSSVPLLSGSDKNTSIALTSAAATTAALPLKKNGLKARTCIAPTSLAAQPSAGVPSSGNVKEQEAGTRAPAAAIKTASARPKTAASPSLNVMASGPPTARDPGSSSSQLSAAVEMRQPIHLSSSLSKSATRVARRPNGSVDLMQATVSPANLDALRSSSTSMMTTSSLSIANPTSLHADAEASLAAARPAASASGAVHTDVGSSTAVSIQPRRASASFNATKTMSQVSSPTAPRSWKAAATHTDPSTAPLGTRQRTRQPKATTSKLVAEQAMHASANSADSAASLDPSLTVAQMPPKSGQSLSTIDKTKVMRRAGSGLTSTRLQTTNTASRQSSLSAQGTSSNITVSMSNAPVVRHQAQANHSTAPVSDVVRVPSKMQDTAQPADQKNGNTSSNACGAVLDSSHTHRSHGPVISEEWARSIIKPGDEHLLYVPANAATTNAHFARTPSSIGMNTALSNVPWTASRDRESNNDTQLRRAQAMVLRRRHAQTPTPSRRSNKSVSAAASSVASAPSGGSIPIFGSTAEQSCAYLPPNLQGGEGRYGWWPKGTMATPRNQVEGSMTGERISNTGTTFGSSSTPLRMSDGSTNTRLGSGSVARLSFEPLSGAASISVGILGQRRSPSLTLFAKPSPRTYATPSPGGSTGGSALMTSFKANSGPYSVSNEELTRLTRVREEVLRDLLQCAPSSTVADDGDMTLDPLEKDNANACVGIDPKLTTKSFDSQADHSTVVPPTTSSAGKTNWQRVYRLDLSGDTGNDERPPPMSLPVGDQVQPRGRLLGCDAASLLAFSIRRAPGSPTVRADRGSSSAAPEAGPTPSTPVSRPTLDSTLFVPGTTSAASATAARQARRPGVVVSLSSLQSASTVAERVRLGLVRQEQQQLDASQTEGKQKVPLSPATNATHYPKSTSIDAVTRRLLLDPLFPLMSEENYQRLVLQNNEYTARTELLAFFERIPMMTAATAVLPWNESSSPLQPLDLDELPRPSGTVPLPAARALDVDLAEADDPNPAAAAKAPLSPSNWATTSSTPPRRPSVQYGGPALLAAYPTSHAPSPSPTVLTPKSPTSGSAIGSVGSTSPGREGKTFVNTALSPEKTGSIKLQSSGSVRHAAVAALDSVWVSADQPHLSGSLAGSSSGGGGTEKSPARTRSASPTASCSSRNVIRRDLPSRSSNHLHHQRTVTATTSSCSDSTEKDESTASDEAVDLAEKKLCTLLQRWGPFRPSPTEPPPLSNTVQQKHTTNLRTGAGNKTTGPHLITAPHKTKRLSHKGTASSVLSADSAPTLTASTGPVLSPAMAEELHAYVHVFLKRYRNAETDTSGEIGPIPDTPLALQRAIRRSLRLSTERNGSTPNQEDATELQDPLDDGSYHSENVQYVLDLVGSLMQAESSFGCDDAVETVGDGTLSVQAKARHKRKRVTAHELVAVVMGSSVPSSGEETSVAIPPNYPKTVSGEAAATRSSLKLHHPRLCAVELMLSSYTPLELGDA